MTIEYEKCLNFPYRIIASSVRSCTRSFLAKRIWLHIVISWLASLLVSDHFILIVSRDFIREYFPHSFIGACNMFISHPLDTVKTNMQSGNMRFTQAAKLLFKTEGVSVRHFISIPLDNFTNTISASHIGKIILSGPSISIMFNWFFEFGDIRCLWQFV